MKDMGNKAKGIGNRIKEEDEDDVLSSVAAKEGKNVTMILVVGGKNS
jgi:hypothetical protein